MQTRLQDRVAIVTGAATGIGAATVARFQDEGAKVVAAGLEQELLRQVAETTGAVSQPCDVTSELDVRRLIDVTMSRFHRLDIVVNSAGVVIPDNVASVTDDGWERTLKVNLTGTMRVCRAAVAHLIQGGSGAVVNISSVAAFNASSGMASYATSKAGVIALTRALANEYGSQGIRANVVCPGWVRTPMSDAEMREMAAARGIATERVVAEIEARLALRRLGEATEIASVVAFLASDDASFITGASIVADGGARTPATARAV